MRCSPPSSSRPSRTSGAASRSCSTTARSSRSRASRSCTTRRSRRLRTGGTEEARTVIESALARERELIDTIRDLSFAIEPVVLRDQGFAAAVRALADQIEQARPDDRHARRRRRRAARREGPGRPLPDDSRGARPGRATPSEPASPSVLEARRTGATPARSPTTASRSGGGRASTRFASAPAS